jgi:hypothetical protein
MGLVTTFAVEQFQLSASREILLSRNCLESDFKGLHFVVCVASRLGQANHQLYSGPGDQD